MGTAFVVFEENHGRVGDLILRPGHNILTGENEFQLKFSNTTSLEEDLLIVAAAIFGCDLAFKRGQCEGFTRKIELTIPVVNLAAFNAIRNDLQYAVYILSNDAWTISFVQRQGSPEAPGNWDSGKDGKVLLFSGGLDSLSAAIKYGESKEVVQLVSHVTGNHTVREAQTALFEYLQTQYPNQFTRLAIRVSGRNRGNFQFPRDHEREETQRTRSLVFLALAALTARRRGFHRIVLIAENGQMAIHLPLTAARISAFSTHTAHPEFVDVMATILSRLLSFDLSIDNPFLYCTKGEVIADLANSHSPIIQQAISCWKASRVPGTKRHCGFCVPCLVRRIAIESHGLNVDEYQRDILAENVGSLAPADDGKRNLLELGEFVCNFERVRSPAKLHLLYPELLNPPIDSGAAIAMYQRFAIEARGVFNRYPGVSTVIQ